jgi:tetratricopeptide (TPR) repeat protein
MKLWRLLIPFLAILPAQAQGNGKLAPEVLYAKSRPSFVTVWTFDANRAPLGQGSGFIVDKNRVVTNYHVVAGSSSASVVYDDGSMAPVKAIVAGSAPKDLVVVEAETGKRPALALGDELQLKIGEPVYAIGTPKGLTASLSNGLVSAFRQDEGQFLIQITAIIAPGSSGGPLLNSQGQVVGITTSRLKDGSFGFAVGAGDLRHLLMVPLSVRLSFSDLAPEEAATSKGDLGTVQALFDEKKYEDAHAAFDSLSQETKNGFDGELLLCKIEQETKRYSKSVEACDAAIRSRPQEAVPYGLKAFSLLSLGEIVQAELPAAKAAGLSNDFYFKKLLGVIHYSEEKYELVPQDIPSQSNDAFGLTLLAGAALHNHDYDSFRQLRDRIATLKADNGWTLFTDAVAAQRDLKWDLAADNYRKCDADDDFIDPICIISLSQVETIQSHYDSAKRDIDTALSRYPKNHRVLSAGIFIYLLVGNTAGADRLHDALQLTGDDDGAECLYFYGRNQAALATNHCAAATRTDEKSYVPWSNAGYVALDNGDFQSARVYFARASQIFSNSKDKHTVTQELDIYWGAITAAYYAGDRKDAKDIYRALKKTYPQFMTTPALKELPLVWSDRTVALINKITSDFK